MLRGYIPIATAALILGVTPETLRVWDKRKVLKAKRAKNGYRMYRISELERFAQKSGLRRAGQKRKLSLK
jgi:DNA-binding transcriptional MerR regulator